MSPRARSQRIDLPAKRQRPRALRIRGQSAPVPDGSRRVRQPQADPAWRRRAARRARPPARRPPTRPPAAHANAMSTTVTRMIRITSRVRLRHARCPGRRATPAWRPRRAGRRPSPAYRAVRPAHRSRSRRRSAFARLSLTSSDVKAPCSPRSPSARSIATRGSPLKLGCALRCRPAISAACARAAASTARSRCSSAHPKAVFLQRLPDKVHTPPRTRRPRRRHRRAAFAQRHAVPGAPPRGGNRNALTQSQRGHWTPAPSETRMRAPEALTACSVASPAPASCSSSRPAASASSLARSNVQWPSA